MSRMSCVVTLAFVLPIAAGASLSVGTPKPARAFTGHLIGCNDVAFSRDGKKLASASIDGDIRQVFVWDIATGKLMHRFNDAAGFAFDTAGTRFAVGQSHGQAPGLTVLDLESGKKLYRLPQPGATTVGWPVFSPDGKRLYYRIEVPAAELYRVTLKAVDPDNGKPRGTLVDDQPSTMARPVLFANGKRLACSRFDTVTILDVATGRPTAKLTGHKYNVRSVALVPGDKMLLSTGADDTVRAWDLASGKPLWTASHRGAGCVLATPDGKHVLSGGEDETLRVWNAATGKQVAAHKLVTQAQLPDNAPNGKGIVALALSPDGRSLAIAGYDPAVKVYLLEDLLPKG